MILSIICSQDKNQNRFTQIMIRKPSTISRAIRRHFASYSTRSNSKNVMNTEPMLTQFSESFNKSTNLATTLSVLEEFRPQASSFYGNQKVPFNTQSNNLHIDIDDKTPLEDLIALSRLAYTFNMKSHMIYHNIDRQLYNKINSNLVSLDSVIDVIYTHRHILHSTVSHLESFTRLSSPGQKNTRTNLILRVPFLSL